MSASIPEQIRCVIRATMRMFDKHGYEQEGYNNANGYPLHYSGVDLLDAIHRSISPKEWQIEAIKAISRHVCPNGRGTSIEIVEWQGKRGRTFDDIRNVFEAVTA